MAATFKEVINGILSSRIADPAAALAALLASGPWTFTGEPVKIGTAATEVITGATPSLQVSDDNAFVALFRYAVTAGGPNLVIGHSRNATLGAHTLLLNGDELGGISFSASDGAQWRHNVARIQAFIDGVPGAGDVPTQLVFQTTPDGGITALTRMAIRNTGRVDIGSVNPSAQVLFIDSTAAAGPYATFGRNGTPFGDIGNGANMGGTYAQDALALDSRNNPLQLGTNATKRIDITTGGDIGINCTPVGTVPLRIQDDAFNDAGIEIGRVSSTVSYVQAYNRAGATYTTLQLYGLDLQFLPSGGAESFRIDQSTTAGQTRLMIYDVDNALLERVTVGGVDSGGAGFKVLRIPN